MKKVLAGVFALVCAFVVLNGRTDFHWDLSALAATPTPVPSCQFAGYDQYGSLVNTTIVCVSPVPSGTGLVTTVGATATACGAAVTPGPAGGAVVIQVPVCATSSPQITPSPTASGGINISGAYPYTIFASPAAAQSTPSPTASGGINISGSYPYTIFASPAVPQTTPSPTASGGINISGSYPYTIFASPAVPQNTASPTATSTSTAGAPSCTYSGAFPYTQTCDFPVAGAAPSFSASPPVVVATPAGQVNISCPTCSTGGAGALIRSGANNSWLAYVETLGVANEHIWALFDAAGSGTAADSAASSATAVASAVPMATSTPSITTQPQFGCPGISYDGNTSVCFAKSGFFVVPASTLPGLNSDWSMCYAQKAAPYSNADMASFGFTNSGCVQLRRLHKCGFEEYQNLGSNATFTNGPATGSAAEYHCLTYNHTTPL